MDYPVSWTRKYIPRECSAVAGQQLAVSRLKAFLLNYGKSRKKAALLHGFTGSGKTCSVYAAASELGCEVLEINASDFRNAASINSVIGPAMGQMSLFSGGKVILVDELDGISGRHDRGGIAALAKLLSKGAFPVVMTANDPWDKKFSPLRKLSERIEFRPLSASVVRGVLKRICESEGVAAEESAIMSMANRSGGDLRAAITDLQILSGATGSLSQADVDSLSDRNRVVSMVNALTRILKGLDFDAAAAAFDGVDERPEEWFLWIDENLPSEYINPAFLARAYEAVSSADVFSGRITRTQYWRLLLYVKLFLTAGVATAKGEKSPAVVNYKPTSRLLKIWMANARNRRRRAIAEKIAEHTHTSPSKVVQDFHYYRTILGNSSNSGQLAGELGLDREELEWLRK